MTVYKNAEQLLAAINGAKGRMGSVEDWRVLTPQRGQPDPLLYVAQSYHESWDFLDLPPIPCEARPCKVAPKKGAGADAGADAGAEAGGSGPGASGKDSLFTCDLVACLLPATAANRTEWVKVGHICLQDAS